jgi:hypothetical protein
MITAIAASSTAVPGKQVDPVVLMREVNLNASPPDETVDFRMQLIDTDMSQRSRTASLYSRRRKDNEWFSLRMIRFHTPTEMAKSAVLIHESSSSNNEQWIYLPATYSTRQIPSQKRGDRYMGTDFSYEDASSPNVPLYTYKLLKAGSPIVQIEQSPNDQKLRSESAYSRSVFSIDLEKRVIIKAEHYNREGILCKVMQASDIKQYGNHYRPDHVEMEDLLRKHKTVIDYSNRKIGTSISENFFSIRNLERGVR